MTAPRPQRRGVSFAQGVLQAGEGLPKFRADGLPLSGIRHEEPNLPFEGDDA